MIVLKDEMGFGGGMSTLIQNSFCSLYFAYDDYVCRCFRAMGGNDKIWTTDDTFSDQFKTLLNNDKLHRQCWMSNEVVLAKKARSLIVHSACEYRSRKFPRFPKFYQLDMAKKRVLIHANGVRYLHGILVKNAADLYRQVLLVKPV